jgi:hypothetical protein
MLVGEFLTLVAAQNCDSSALNSTKKSKRPLLAG